MMEEECFIDSDDVLAANGINEVFHNEKEELLAEEVDSVLPTDRPPTSAGGCTQEQPLWSKQSSGGNLSLDDALPSDLSDLSLDSFNSPFPEIPPGRVASPGVVQGEEMDKYLGCGDTVEDIVGWLKAGYEQPARCGVGHNLDSAFDGKDQGIDRLASGTIQEKLEQGERQRRTEQLLLPRPKQPAVIPTYGLVSDPVSGQIFAVQIGSFVVQEAQAEHATERISRKRKSPGSKSSRPAVRLTELSSLTLAKLKTMKKDDRKNRRNMIAMNLAQRVLADRDSFALEDLQYIDDAYAAYWYTFCSFVDAEPTSPSSARLPAGKVNGRKNYEGSGYPELLYGMSKQDVIIKMKEQKARDPKVGDPFRRLRHMEELFAYLAAAALYDQRRQMPAEVRARVDAVFGPYWDLFLEEKPTKCPAKKKRKVAKKTQPINARLDDQRLHRELGDRQLSDEEFAAMPLGTVKSRRTQDMSMELWDDTAE